MTVDRPGPELLSDPDDLDDNKLVERTRAGDERCLEALISRYRNFARSKARSYFLAGSEKEDVVQEGMIGLYKAIRDFDPGMDTPFRAFAELCISRQIMSAIKSANRLKHKALNTSLSLDAPIRSEEGEPHTVGEVLPAPVAADPAQLVVSAEQIEALRDAMKEELTQLESDVLKLYMAGRSYEQIADTLGNHTKSIDNALQRIKRKLGKHLGEENALAS